MNKHVQQITRPVRASSPRWELNPIIQCESGDSAKNRDSSDSALQYSSTPAHSDRTADVPGVLQSQVPPFEPVAYLISGGSPCRDATAGAEDPEDAERHPEADRADSQPTMTSLQVTVQTSSMSSLTCSKKAQAEIGGNGHFKSNAAHDFAKLKQSFENQNNKAKSENTAQTAKSDDLAEAEKRLTSLKTYRAASKSTCSQLGRTTRLQRERLANVTKVFQSWPAE